MESPLIGQFNMANTLAAIAAANHAGVPPSTTCKSAAGFLSVKRRLELLAEVGGISIYDDFAHHPTAVAQTLRALRQRVGSDTIVCVFEPRSNTMLDGSHRETLPGAFTDADRTVIFKPEKIQWDVEALADEHTWICASVTEIVRSLSETLQSGDHVVIMSNGSFANIHQKLIDALGVTLSQR